jgi:cytochrome c-type biogenesis protein CcmE
MSDSAVPVSSTPRPGARRTRWFAIAALGLALAALIAIALGGIGRNIVYYWGPSELRAAGDKAVGASIRLGGQVAKGSVAARDATTVEFDVTDGKNSVRVRAHGMPPQMFREGIGVVVEGTFTAEGYFEGTRLMVSHGNEYRAPGEGEKVDVRKLMRSTEGLDEDPHKDLKR